MRPSRPQDTRTAARAAAIPGRAASGLLALMTAIVLLALLAMPTRAATRAEVENFLEVTGFDVALESIKFSAASGPAMLGLQDSDFATTWGILTDDIFDPDKMQEMGVEILQDTIDDSDLTEVNDFYASDLGQALVAAENDSHMADRTEREAASVALLDQLLTDGAGERIALLDRLNRAVSSSDDSERALVEVQFRFLLAARDAGVIEFRTDDAQMREMLVEQMRAARDANHSASLAHAAYTYEDFTNEELIAYAEALESPAMQRVYELMNAVQSEIMANRFEAVAARLEGLAPATDL